MTVAEAKALCADLDVLAWDEIVIARAITETTAALLAASPQVTPAAGEPGLWWIGAAGIESVGGERALLRALADVGRLWHPRPRIAVADSCVAARAATWAGAGHRATTTFLVPPGGDAAYLAPAPLALIPMDDELRAILETLGLRTAGALAALEAGDVESRWGEVGLAAWRFARGEDRRRPVLARPDAPRSVDVELPAPTTTMEPVLFLVRAALERLIEELVADGRSAAAIAITLTLDGARSALPSGAAAHTVTREVRFPRPVARLVPLFEQCRMLLDTWRLDAPACGVTIAVVATAPSAGEQGDLMASAWRDPAAADAAFARLRAELGPDAVVRPVAHDEHRPERAGGWVGVGEEVEMDKRVPADLLLRHAELDDPSSSPASLAGDATALRLLEQPEPVEIERDAGLPCAIWWRGRRLGITRASGPERLSGEWWKDEYGRDYWRCESDTSGELVIFSEAGEWRLQGWYD